MRLDIPKEVQPSIYGDETDPVAQRGLLADYLESTDGPSGVKVSLTPDEQASIFGSEADPAKRKALAKAFVVQKLRAQPKPAVNVEDMSAYAVGREALGVRRDDVLNATPEVAAAITKAGEFGVRSQVLPRVADEAIQGGAALDGEMSRFQKVADLADFGLSVPGAMSLVSRGAGLVTAASRPIFSTASWIADAKALSKMPPDEREAFVNGMDDRYPQKDGYRKIVDAMAEVEREKPGATWEDIQDSWGVAASGASLAGDYFMPMNEADPYGGSAPRPWATPGRDPDALDVVMRGILGMSDPDVIEASRRSVQKYTSPLGAPFRSIGSAVKVAGDAYEAADNPVDFASEWFTRWRKQAQADEADVQERIASGDTTAGLGFANFVLMAGPDVALPAAKSADLAHSTIGRISREAEIVKTKEQVRRLVDVVDEAERLAGRKLDPAELKRLQRMTNSAVDTAFATVADTAKAPIAGIDTAGAISVADTAEGFVVRVDPSKVVTVKAEQAASSFFPKPAPAVRAARAANRKVVAALGGNTSGGGVALVRSAEWLRSAFGKGPPLVVKDGAGWRVPEAMDVVGPHMWELAKSASGKGRRVTQNEIITEMNGALRSLWEGTSGPKERDMVRKYVEMLGDPSADAADAAAVYSAMEKAVLKGLEALPEAMDELAVQAVDVARAAKAAQAELAAAEQALAAAAATGHGPSVAAARKARDDAYRAASAASDLAKQARRMATDSAVIADARAAKQKAARDAAKAEVALRDAEQAAAAGGAVPTGPGIDALRVARDAAQAALDAADSRLSATMKALAAGSSGDIATKAFNLEKARRAVDAAARKRTVAYSMARNARRAGKDTSRLDAAARSANHSFQKSKRLYDEAVAAAKEDLDAVALDAMDALGGRARLLGDVMESLTGSRSSADAAARAALGKELRAVAANAEAIKKNADLVKALDGLTLGDAKMAERAWKRIANGTQSIDDFNSLSPNGREALKAVETYFDGMFSRLNAAGRLPKDYSRARFLERMQVDGYLPHMLSKNGRSQMLKALRKAGGGDLSTVINSVKTRELAGTVDELNQAARERVAKLILDAEQQAGRVVDETADEAIARIIDDYGLAKENLFETDPLIIVPKYAADTARGLANQQVLTDLIIQFPEGEKFAGMVKNSDTLAEADALARQAGFRRVDGATMLRSLDPQLAAWNGWSKEPIRKLLASLDQFSDAAVDRVFAELRAAGAPIDEIVSAGTRPELRKPVYLPAMVADELDELARPSLWRGIPESIRRFPRAFTAVWKSGMTVLAPSFHSRNYISNVLSSYMRNGWDAVSPSTQITAMSILQAADDVEITINKISKTAKVWRDEMRRAGVIQDTVGFTGDKVPAEFKVRMKQGMAAYLVGGAAGAAAGAANGDDPADKVRQAFFGALAVSTLAGAGSANFDYYLRGGLKARKEAGGWLSLSAWMAGADEAWGQMMESARRAGEAGTVAAGIGAAWGAPVGVGALSGAASGSSAALFSLIGEPAFVLGGGVGRHIEDMAKISNAIADLKKGGSLEAAARAADDATFDYADLTFFEREVLRTAFPFYTWGAKNVGLQSWLLANEPKRYAALLKFMKATESDYSAWELPEYYSNRWIIQAGAGRVIAGASTGPEAAVEWMTKGPSGVASLSNPIAKTLIEMIGEKSLFYGVPITKLTTGRDYQHMPDFIKRDVGYADDVIDTRTGKIKPPAIGYFQMSTDELRSLSPEDYAKTLEGKSGVRYRRDVKLATYRHQIYSNHPVKRILTEANKALQWSFMSGVDPTDPTTRATTFDRFLSAGTGFKVTHVDPKTRQEVEWETQRRLREALDVNGIGYSSARLPVEPNAPLGHYLVQPEQQ
jgi:hypothetical protein